MLSVDDPRIEPLRGQRARAVVTGMCTCGCASVNLDVDREHSRPADICGQPISADLNASQADLTNPNEHYGLMVFLDEGWLSLLEIWWIENPPKQFPPTSWFDTPRVTCDK